MRQTGLCLFPQGQMGCLGLLFLCEIFALKLNTNLPTAIIAESFLHGSALSQPECVTVCVCVRVRPSAVPKGAHKTSLMNFSALLMLRLSHENQLIALRSRPHVSEGHTRCNNRLNEMEGGGEERGSCIMRKPKFEPHGHSRHVQLGH